MAISITKKTHTTNTTASSGRTISYIVIHYTAGVTSKSGSAANTAAYFNNSSVKASADFIVDDATIVQYNPDVKNRYCWHCGGSKYSTKGGSYYGKCKNSNSIGIEICSTNTTGKVQDVNASTWKFTTKALAKATELTLYLMDKYGIDADHVIRHYDVTGKLCPGIKGWNKDSGSETKWKNWKKGLTTATVPTFKKGKKYKLLNNLYVRKSPNASAEKVGYKNFTAAGKKKDENKDGAFDKGKKIVAKQVKTKSNGNIWVKCGNGWLLAYNARTGKTHMKEVS